MRCSDGSFPEMPRVDGCEGAEGLGHLQNLQRGHLKADLQQAKDVEAPQNEEQERPPKRSRLPRGLAASEMVEPRWAPTNSCCAKIALAPLEGCHPSKVRGHEPLEVHRSILQEVCLAQVGATVSGKATLDGIQRWNQQDVLPAESLAGPGIFQLSRQGSRAPEAVRERIRRDAEAGCARGEPGASVTRLLGDLVSTLGLQEPTLRYGLWSYR